MCELFIMSPLQSTASDILIEPRAVDESRPLRIVVIGAGISGILAFIRLNQRVPNLDLCIYDKNADIGGTWLEANVIIQATGALNNRRWPNIPGLHDFGGKLLHSASWDVDYDHSLKWYSIQIVLGMLQQVAHIDHYVRSRTWIAPRFAREYLEQRGSELDNCEEVLHRRSGVVSLLIDSDSFLIDTFTAEEIKSFETDHQDFGRIKSEITKIDRSGIVIADGEHREVDAIVCATEFDTTHTPHFPITGRAGMTLATRWKQIPEIYLSVAVNGFPNYYTSWGSNTGLDGGNLLILIERQIDNFTQCIRKVQRDNIRALSMKANAVHLFTQYCDSCFAGTVIFPHAIEVVASPRWEDFDIEYVNNNPMSWFGDGWTQNEKLDQINVDYLDDDRVDFPQPAEIMHSVNIL
ncbi:hypothetical protein N7539_004834 [Penicillium diatomitis]|uniref:Uncharacterized protein n=1 Tax=Penicillium diatomitis TaxID=2819901 RepID=A0A9X0BUH6_9EURO|nr:uncharacterized protein N7539_004834 [Penicillium diatomitis]KAJ5484846.1 hypothetical protein N7539_004834 [Penicillium diatomitis]